MYLAQRVVGGRLHFVISHSFKRGKWWRNADLLDLGTEPARFVVLTDRDGFYVHERVEEELQRQGVEPGEGELEDLFLPFIPVCLRGNRERWWHRPGQKNVRPGYAEQKRLEAQISMFDRRRLHYLKCGFIDLSGISVLPIRYFLPLADKSRDEIEQCLLHGELKLKPDEYKSYVYAAFNLQRFFATPLARTMPQTIDQQELDRMFIEELCRINASPWYWMRANPPDRLHPSLVRYLIMFFDYDFAHDRQWEEFVRRFMDNRRHHRPPVFRGKVAESEAEELFGRTREELRQLSRRELAALYRKRAHLFHPDKGGDHEKFIRLSRAYELLLQESRSRRKEDA